MSRPTSPRRARRSTRASAGSRKRAPPPRPGWLPQRPSAPRPRPPPNRRASRRPKGQNRLPPPTVAGNRIELWGRILGAPELRVTPAGTPILRIVVDCGDAAGDLAMTVFMTGESAQRARASLKAGSQVKVAGSLKAARRRAKSGLLETGYEVMAASIAVEE